MPQHPAPLSFAAQPAAFRIAMLGPIPISAFWWQCPWKKTSGPVPSFQAIPRSSSFASFARNSSIMNACDARAATPPEPLPLDLGSLSLDLGEEFQNSKAALADLSDDPLETKLDLAEEFRAIGDEDGARALIEEVIEAASGDMKTRAERALSKLK